MANERTSKTQPPLSEVFEAIERETGVYTNKDEQERFLRKLLVPKYIPKLNEPHVATQVTTYRLSLGSKLKGHTHSLGKGVNGGRGRPQNYGINHLFLLGPKKVVRPDFLKRQGCDFDASLQESSGSVAHRQSATKSKASSRADTAKPHEVNTSGASRLDTAPTSPSPLTTALQDKSFSVDLTSPATNEKKRTAAVESEEPGSEKRRKTGLGSQTAAKLPASGEKKRTAIAVDEEDLASRKRPKTVLISRELEAQPSTQRPPSKLKLKNSAASSPVFSDPAASTSAPTAAAGQAPSSSKEKPDVFLAHTSAVNVRQLSAADHVGPTVPVADPEELREWKLRSGVLLKQPISQPTFRPHSDGFQVFPYGDRNWLLGLWKGMEKNLWFAMVSLFGEHSIEDTAPSHFVSTPSPKLRELYETLVGGKGEWETWLVEQSMKMVECLTQDCTIAGMLGAAVYKSVFQADLPWNIKKDFPDLVGKRTMKHFEAAMRDIGHDANDILRNMAAKQYQDEEFQKAEITKYAKQQVGALVLTLQPHIQALVKSSTPKSRGVLPGWTELLEKAFTEAINVKHILQASKLGPFDFQWPEAGVQIDLDEHKCWYEMPGATHMLHTFLPTVRRVMPEGIVIFSHAVCFPWTLPTKKPV